MATVAENLQTAKENFAEQLAEISASPRPTYTIDGESMDWKGYMEFLTKSIAAVDAQLAANDPFEVISEIYTG